jgi:hypothetical protein
MYREPKLFEMSSVDNKPKLFEMSSENKEKAFNAVKNSRAMRRNAKLLIDLESAESVCCYKYSTLLYVSFFMGNR